MLFDYITKPEFWLFHSIKITEIIAWFIEFLLYIRGSACRRKDRLKPLEPSGPLKLVCFERLLTKTKKRSILTISLPWFTEDGELAHAEVGRLLGVGRVDLRGQDGA